LLILEGARQKAELPQGLVESTREYFEVEPKKWNQMNVQVGVGELLLHLGMTKVL